ncbi:endonuclease/exonuclease/phosphatase family protein [Oxalobacteraceae bacterium A2-2]
MQQEIRLATFNVCNLSQPGAKLYDNLAPLTQAEYDAKIAWTARQLDQLDADVIGLQEIFSMAALREVLSHSVRYRDAHLAGFDPAPDPATGEARLAPQVALVSRLPFAAPPVAYAVFPDGVALPAGHGSERDAGRYARAPLHALVRLPDGSVADVLVVHLKSRRPDYRGGPATEAGADCAHDPLEYAQAHLRSLVRRGTEAVALRALLSGLQRSGRPCVVLGDFNDTLDAVTTTIVLGGGAACQPGKESSGRLYDCGRIQRRQDWLRHAGYTNVHEGRYSTIDHVLVSDAFHPDAPHAIGEVLDVSYLNDHLQPQRPEASDHGQVLVRLRLYGAGAA